MRQFVLITLIVITAFSVISSPSYVGHAMGKSGRATSFDFAASPVSDYIISSGITIGPNSTLYLRNQTVIFQSQDKDLGVIVQGRLIAQNCTFSISNQSFSSVQKVNITGNGNSNRKAVMFFENCRIMLNGLIGGTFVNFTIVNSSVSRSSVSDLDTQPFLSIKFENSTVKSINSTFSGLYSNAEPPREAAGYINLSNPYFSNVGKIPTSPSDSIPAFANSLNVSLEYFINGNTSAGDYINASFDGRTISSVQLPYFPSGRDGFYNYSVNTSFLGATASELSNSSLFYFTAAMGPYDAFELI
ncbi:MAG: hypothetical protein QW812_05810, partial [Thermoplasmataceae archaeon]